MLNDHIVLITIWIFTIAGLFKFIPRNKLRDAQIIFFFKQFMTWFLGLVVVQLGLIVYPIREFPKATQTSFSFEYFLYPAICVVFNLHFPEKKNWVYRVAWFLLFPTWMTVLEALIERYTNLVLYIYWEWYWTWITLFFTFLFSRLYYIWFRKRLC